MPESVKNLEKESTAKTKHESKKRKRDRLVGAAKANKSFQTSAGKLEQFTLAAYGRMTSVQHSQSLLESLLPQ